jgi:hypothetical protein
MQKIMEFRISFALSVLVAASNFSIAGAYFMNQTNGTMSWCSATNCLGNMSYNLVVGQLVTFNVTAVNIQSRSSTVAIDAVADPGLPNGAQLSATSFLPIQVAIQSISAIILCEQSLIFVQIDGRVQANFLNASARPRENWTVTYRTFSFTPQRRQEGLRYQVLPAECPL